MTADIDIECKAIVYVLLLRVSRMAKDQLTFSNQTYTLFRFSAFDQSSNIDVLYTSYTLIHVCLMRSTDHWPKEDENQKGGKSSIKIKSPHKQ